MVKLFPIALMMPMMAMMNTTNKRAILGLALPQRIIRALAELGSEARFCGGVVRDMLLGDAIALVDGAPVDVDMASPLPPAAAMKCLEAAGLRVIPSGIDHGTITVLDPPRPLLRWN